MTVSNIVNAPVRWLTDCAQTINENKKTIVKVAAGVSIVALAVILYSNKKNLDDMQDVLKIHARYTDSNSFGGQGSSRAEQCSGTAFKFETESLDCAEVLKKVENLFNQATSNGRDLLSQFDFFAARRPLNENCPSGINSSEICNGGKSTFIICRSGLSELFTSFSRALYRGK